MKALSERAPLPPIDHIGIVVHDLVVAVALYRELGCEIAAPVTLPGQGIDKAYVHFANMTIELITPNTPNSPIRHLLEDQNASDFLARHPEGGLHHICCLVANIASMQDELVARGWRMLGTHTAAAGNASQIAWIDSAGADGVLIEIKQGACGTEEPQPVYPTVAAQ